MGKIVFEVTIPYDVPLDEARDLIMEHMKPLGLINTISGRFTKRFKTNEEYRNFTLERKYDEIPKKILEKTIHD